MTYKSINGVGNQGSVQKIIWDREDLIGGPDIAGLPIDYGRPDAATVRALINMLDSVKTFGGRGLIFAVVNNNSTLDLGATGGFYDSPILAQWAVSRLHRLIEHVPGHPDQISHCGYP